MKMRKIQNHDHAQGNRCENEVWSRLKDGRYSFNRQSSWGYRVFDFWCHELGVAIEVDGNTHDAGYDAYRDEWNFRRSAIVVLRMRNGDMRELGRIMKLLPKLHTRSYRKKRLGIGRRNAFTDLPYPPSLLEKYLKTVREGGVDFTGWKEWKKRLGTTES